MISVVIPARNAADTIASTLASLAPDRRLIREVLLVDDASNDETVARAGVAAAEHGLPLKVMPVRHGSAGAARNAGLAQARGDFIFYLDADDEVIPGGLGLLLQALRGKPEAGLAVGASIHRSRHADKLKLPGEYAADRAENARKYLSNELRSITVGSALVSSEATTDVRFPERVVLDEDTIYWAALLMRADVATIEQPVLVYNLDEVRMAQRFVSNPRKVFLDLALELNGLTSHGIGKRTLQERKAFIAQRIARHLIRRNRYAEAAGMMRAARHLPGFPAALKSLQYRIRIESGRTSLARGRGPDARRSSALRKDAPRRILVLTADPAVPSVSGADLRNHQNAIAATRMGEVLLVSVRPVDPEAAAGAGIETAALSRMDDPRGKSLSNWRSGVEARITQTHLARLLTLVRRFRPDTVIIEGIPLFALIEHLRPLVPRLILDMHNIESLLAAEVRPSKSFLGRLLPRRWRDAGRIRRREEKALAMVDRVWVCSDVDRERLRLLYEPKIPIDVIPNGIPRADRIPPNLPAVPGKESGWPVMLFVGHLGYQPNVAAAKRLANNILPLVRRTFPQARLILAGRQPDPSVKSLAVSPGVEVIENPQGLSPLFARSHLSVMPLAAGGGTRIKILEAMAWGLPVVATAVAAEGQGFRDGAEIAIAETDEALVWSIIALCSEPEQFENQRQLARETVLRRYGPSTVERAVGQGLGLADVSDQE